MRGETAQLRVRKVRLSLAEAEAPPGQDPGQDFEAERITVGSARGNDLVLSDPAVSRHHFEIAIGEGGYLLRDLGSTNGTYVEGLRVREVFLKSPVVVEAGSTRLRFESLPDEGELELSAGDRFGELYGQSSALRRIFALLAKLAARDVTVLITGESGTGKELVARALHEASARGQGPMVVVDCGAMPANLMESEILGHERGAFTGADKARAGAFERADGGTLFLDEIGELPLELQPKLLRVLETREVARLGGSGPRKVDVRVVAATNRDLRTEVNRSTFRGDLFFRLSVVEIRLPALRERPEDIPLLVRHFLDDIARREGGQRTYELSPRTLEKLARHGWPGNIRELRNFVERAVTLADSRMIEGTLSGLGAVMPPPALSPVGAAPGPSAPGEASTPAAPARGPTDELLLLPFRTAKQLYTEPFEREYLEALLARTGGNVSKASREADIDRSHLIALLKKYDLK
jgi:DNA-binding NtrC family response regulator